MFVFLRKIFHSIHHWLRRCRRRASQKIRRVSANELEHSVRFLLQPNGSRVDLLLSYKAPHLFLFFFFKPMVFSICSAKMEGKTNLWIEKEKKTRVYIVTYYSR